MKTRLIAQKAQMNNNSSPQVEIVNRVMGIKEWGLIIILSILWGGSFFFVGVAVKEMPPLTIVLCRVALASIILLVIVYLKGDKMPSSPGLWGAFIIMGALKFSDSLPSWEQHFHMPVLPYMAVDLKVLTHLLWLQGCYAVPLS
jgi:hypothetical protein